MSIHRLAAFVENLSQDLRYAIRSLGRSPGFAVTAILTVAIGIGANTGLFSLVNAVAFRELPVPQPEDLLAINQEVSGIPRGSNNSASFSRAEYERYRDSTQSVSGLIAYGRMWTATAGGDEPQPIVATPVSCNYFDVLRIVPVRGGRFADRHCVDPSGSQVTVITHSFWLSRFGGDEGVIGRALAINGTEFEIIGIAPEGFAGIDIDRPSAFVPYTAQPMLRPDRDYLNSDLVEWLNLVGRIAPGQTAEQVAAEFGVVAAALDSEQPDRRTSVTVNRATALAAPDMRTGVLAASGIVLFAFGLILVVAGTNVANLLLARADSRLHETGIRLSLGASRARVLRQFLTESCVLALAGGAVGTLFSMWGIGGLVPALLGALPENTGQLLNIDPVFDPRVLLFAVGISLLAGIAFGFAPAMSVTGHHLRTVLDATPARASRHGSRKVQSTLLATQVAVSMALVVATALLVRGFYEARTVNPTFDHESLIVANADLRSFGYDAEAASILNQDAMSRIDALPGVDGVAQAFVTPLEPRTRTFSFRLPDSGESRIAMVNSVSPNYFAVAGIPVVRGRAFAEAEAATSQAAVVVVTESTAASFWPGENPIGKPLILEGFGETPVEVIGIARDIEVSRIAETNTSYVYLPATIQSQPELQLVMRISAPISALQPQIEAIFESIDPRLPLRVRPLAENFAFWTELSGLAAGLALGLSVLALALASVGVFGVMSTTVSGRVREIGIRLALGAGRMHVLTAVLARSMVPVAAGGIIGIAVCLALARLLSAVLFGVSPADPVALSAAVLTVFIAAFIAGLVPARRALSVDPMTTLRYE